MTTKPEVSAVDVELPDFTAVQEWWDNGSDNHELFTETIQDYARQAVVADRVKQATVRDALVVNMIRFSALTKNQAKAIIDFAFDGIEPDADLFAKQAGQSEAVGWQRQARPGVWFEIDEKNYPRETFPEFWEGARPIYTTPQPSPVAQPVNAELVIELALAASTLRNYEAQHRAKGAAESNVKAEFNNATATRFEAALSRTQAAQPPAVDGLSIERAAKKLAERFDYPWVYMPDKGRETMRQHAQAILDAAQPQQKDGE